MLESLAAATGVELGKFVLDQVLNLSKPVLEKYVQDFFKDCLTHGVAQLQVNTLKAPMAEAIGYFIKRFREELLFNDVPPTSIQHHYQGAIKKFVQDQAVLPILGKAFEKDCKQIDYGQLAQIWTQQYQVASWQFPAEEFDWRGLCKKYVYEVKGIVKANSELRSLLTTDLIADIARNTTPLSPGFDIETYRASLQSSYGYLKLSTLDGTYSMDAIKLWAIFIEQTVREALPALRYDLPRDVQQKSDFLKKSDFSEQSDFWTPPACKVLGAITESQKAVILGDPGSGKSSLLQYLALEWVEGQTSAVAQTAEVSRLPLLIELREFALNPAANFLEFLHRGRGVDWQFDQQQLHQHLLEFPTLVMFDGLDEIFDRATQATVIDDIMRFAQQYPQAQILVTSRLIGYNLDRLQHAGFRHFTIQSLDPEEMHEFIDRWYDLSMGSDPDKVRLKQRLKDAIVNSKAITNLADNPLLLTMMAILNRRQELPRDRADLYDQASRVLLYHWDVDHKRLHIPMDAIGRREKQEMLRLIAYDMQAGEAGLKGNLIGCDRLTRIITDYLRDQGFSTPRETANLLIQQLRERNFILCYRGADTYGFMHRTFLEYFCAMEIVHRFEKQRTLTFDQLRDEIFGQHWQDETWHEVLRLICGMVLDSVAGELINYLKLNDDSNRVNILLAADCLSEVANQGSIRHISDQLFYRIMYVADDGYLEGKIAHKIIHRIAQVWSKDERALLGLKKIALSGINRYSKFYSIGAIACHWETNPETLDWLINQGLNSDDDWVQVACLREIVARYHNQRDMFPALKRISQSNENPNLQQEAVKLLAAGWRQYTDALVLIKACAESEMVHFGVRSEAIAELVGGWINESWLFDFLRERAICDPFIREHQSNRNPRMRAIEALITHYPTHPKTLELLRDRALNDPDELLREWAAEQLKIQDKKLKVEELS